MYITFDAVIAATDKAVLLSFGDEQVWIPRSIDPDNLKDLHKGDGSGTFHCSERFAVDKGIEAYDEGD